MVLRGGGMTEDWTEAELFTLHWTQYLARPVEPRCLEKLWQQKRKSGSAGGKGHLPIAELAAQRRLAWRKMGKRTGVMFVRSSFSAEDLQEILSASDRFDWCFDIGAFRDWAETALHFDGYRHLRDCEDWVLQCFTRHVAYRYGLSLAREIEVNPYSYRISCPTNAVGCDRAIEREIERTARTSMERRPHSNSNTPNYTDIVACPPGMEPALQKAYARVESRAWPTRDLRHLLRAMAKEESAYLRGGATPFDAETEAELVAHVAADDFLHGESTGWAVERLNALRRTTPLTPWSTLLLQALAFWRRDFDTLEAVGRESPFAYGHKRGVAEALLLLAAGEYETSQKMLSSALGFAGFPQNEHWRFYDLPILILLLLGKMKVAGASGLKKLSRMFEGTPDGYEEFVRYDEPGELARNVRWAMELCAVAGNDPGARRQLSDPTLMPFTYLRILLSTVDAGHYSLPVDDAVALMKRAHEKGYPSIAADVAAILRIVPDDLPGLDAARQAAAAAGVDPSAVLVAPKTIRSHWENALDVLAKALGGQASSKKAFAAKPEPQKGAFFWGVNIDTNRPAHVDRVCPVVREARKSGGLGVVKVVSDKAFIDGKFDDLLTPADHEIKALLVGGGCLQRDHYYNERQPPSLSVLQRLAARDNVLISEEDGVGYWGSLEGEDFSPGRLTCEKAVLNFAMTADGGAEITPVVDYDNLPEKRGYVAKLDASDSTCWRIISLSKEYREASRALSQQTTGSTLRIPAAGLERLEGLFAHLSDHAPVAWRKGVADVRKDVPREATVPKPCVRLTFADDALGAALVVRLSDEPLWTSEPGKGVPERLVVAPDGAKKLLVRDFAAEGKSVAPAHEVLKPFDEARVDETHWYFSNLQDSLAVLASLHEAAAAGTFALEWPDGEKLHLASLVSHSARYEGGTTAEEWLSVSGTFELDDGKVLTFTDLLKSFDQREGAYIRLTEGRYLRLTAAIARRVEALKGAGIERGGKILISPAAIPSLEKVARETEPDEILPLPEILKDRLATMRQAMMKKVETPDGFKCQMRPYQQEGFVWLSRLAACGIGACLADDMGLGKTIQLIALLLERRKDGPSLVVAPASVAFNWRNEIARFAPSLRVALVGQVANMGEEDVDGLAKANDVLVTSYGVLTAREDQFSPLGWNGVVLDEAQAIKNHLTKRAKSVKTLKAKFRVVATGTPIENRLSELWSLFDFINPGMLGGETRFARELAPHGEPTPRLKRLVKPLILRRLKRDVLTDLPDKEEVTVPVVLGDDERHAYEAVRRNAVAKLEADDPGDKIAILAELTRLRRFCCHPSLVMPSVNVSAKLEALEELLDNLRANNHRALVFSQFVDYLALVRKLLERREWTFKYLDGSTPKAERERSVTAFQAGEGDFFLISLKAGGMGLNLTAANYVILLDPWWNPAVENQAADRVHRIGQRLPVTVYRLIAQDTIEEKVIRLHEQKTALAEDVLANGASGLTAKEMFDLLSQK